MEETTVVTGQSKGPGLLERGMRAARCEYHAWRTRRNQGAPDDLFMQSKKDGATVGAAFKNGLIATAAMIVRWGVRRSPFWRRAITLTGARIGTVTRGA